MLRYTRENAYKYLCSKDFKQRRGISKKKKASSQYTPPQARNSFLSDLGYQNKGCLLRNSLLDVFGRDDGRLVGHDRQHV